MENAKGKFKVVGEEVGGRVSLRITYPNISEDIMLIRHPTDEIPLIIDELRYVLAQMKRDEYLEWRIMRMKNNKEIYTRSYEDMRFG